MGALSKGYDVQNFYQLLVDKYECPFATPEALMQEMVSQRLSRVRKTDSCSALCEYLSYHPLIVPHAFCRSSS